MIPDGTRVQTTYGVGVMVNGRPDFAGRVYVKLDHKTKNPAYSGTLVPAIHVTPLFKEDA